MTDGATLVALIGAVPLTIASVAALTTAITNRRHVAELATEVRSTNGKTTGAQVVSTGEVVARIEYAVAVLTERQTAFELYVHERVHDIQGSQIAATELARIAYERADHAVEIVTRPNPRKVNP